MRKIKKQKERLDTLLVSDFHIGSSICRSVDLINVLKKHKYDRLILLGDVFDDKNFDGMDTEQWSLMSFIQDLGKRKDVEIIWIKGNHDHKDLIKIFSRLLGVQVVKEYTWRLNGDKYFAIHGDQFDEYLTKYKTLNKIAVFVYDIFQKMNTKHLRPSKLLRKFFAYSWKRASEKIAVDAVAYGLRKHHAQFVFCGHTHQTMCEKINGVNYYNTGCFSDIPYSFITISKKGEIIIHEHE